MQRLAYTQAEVEHIMKQLQAISVNGKPVFTEVVLRKSFSGHYLGLDTEQDRAVVPLQLKRPSEENEG